MKRHLLLAIAAAALSVPLAPAASAGEYSRGYYPREDRYHDHHAREGRFLVRFHLDGGRGRVHAKSEDRAYRIAELLRSVGADAHVDGRCVVHYRLGPGRVVRRDYEDARRLAQKLSGYGFHARVEQV